MKIQKFNIKYPSRSPGDPWKLDILFKDGTNMEVGIIDLCEKWIDGLLDKKEFAIRINQNNMLNCDNDIFTWTVYNPCGLIKIVIDREDVEELFNLTVNTNALEEEGKMFEPSIDKPHIGVRIYERSPLRKSHHNKK